MNETKVVKFVSLSLLKTIILFFGVFLLVRVIAPSLMDIHSTFAFIIGAMCFPAAILLLLWGALWLWLSYKREFPGSHRDA